MKTNIKMRVTPEQSKRVQEICFGNGIKWNGELSNNLSFTERPFLFILNHLETANKNYDFKSDELEEIDADLFIRTNGTCEEISDEGLSKIKAASNGKSVEYLQEKIINLHKQINKDRNVIKNQKEELNKLNLKLQKCIDLEAHNLTTQKLRDTIVSLRDEVISKVDNMRDTKNKEIEKLKAVIEYLESKVR